MFFLTALQGELLRSPARRCSHAERGSGLSKVTWLLPRVPLECWGLLLPSGLRVLLGVSGREGWRVEGAGDGGPCTRQVEIGSQVCVPGACPWPWGEGPSWRLAAGKVWVGGLRSRSKGCVAAGGEGVRGWLGWRDIYEPRLQCRAVVWSPGGPAVQCGVGLSLSCPPSPPGEAATGKRLPLVTLEHPSRAGELKVCFIFIYLYSF